MYAFSTGAISSSARPDRPGSSSWIRSERIDTHSPAHPQNHSKKTFTGTPTENSGLCLCVCLCACVPRDSVPSPKKSALTLGRSRIGSGFFAAFPSGEAAGWGDGGVTAIVCVVYASLALSLSLYIYLCVCALRRLVAKGKGTYVLLGMLSFLCVFACAVNCSQPLSCHVAASYAASGGGYLLGRPQRVNDIRFEKTCNPVSLLGLRFGLKLKRIINLFSPKRNTTNYPVAWSQYTTSGNLILQAQESFESSSSTGRAAGRCVVD